MNTPDTRRARNLSEEELNRANLTSKERHALKWCRACGKRRNEGVRLFTVAPRWAYGLPPYICNECLE